MNKNSGGAVTSTKTYYPAGGVMRVDGTRYYVLKDHLGSASVVTNQSATTVGEDRFYPFGETRFTTGSMFTDKLFTGQRQITGLGIYHFGARFYSPKLGRFLSADTIVPGYANPQGLNRYSYVSNNPIRYRDPSGHKPCDADGTGNCIVPSDPFTKGQVVSRLRHYHVRMSGNWTFDKAFAVFAAVDLVGTKFASERGLGESASEAFGAVYDHVNIGWGGTGAQGGCASVTSGGCTSSSHQINFWSMSGGMYNDTPRMIKNVVHELGHVFDNSLTYPDPNTGRARRPDQDMPSGLTRETILRPNVPTGRLDWQQHPGADGGEFFADMFIAWTYNAWNTSTDPKNVVAVGIAQDWMDGLAQP